MAFYYSSGIVWFGIVLYLLSLESRLERLENERP